MKSITIPSACTENWEDMTPQGRGRHCAQCAQTVIDFTGFSMQELRAFFQQNSQLNTCGRFTSSQLNVNMEEEQQRQRRTPSLQLAALLSAAAFVFTPDTGSSQVLLSPQHSTVQVLKKKKMIPADTTLPTFITLELVDETGGILPRATVKHRATGYTTVANDSGVVVFPMEKINTNLSYYIFEVSPPGFGTSFIRLEQAALMARNKVPINRVCELFMGKVVVVEQKTVQKKWWKKLFGITKRVTTSPSK